MVTSGAPVAPGTAPQDPRRELVGGLVGEGRWRGPGRVDAARCRPGGRSERPGCGSCRCPGRPRPAAVRRRSTAARWSASRSASAVALRGRRARPGLGPSRRAVAGRARLGAGGPAAARRRRRPRAAEEGELAEQAVPLARREDLHRAELAVVARRDRELAAADPAHRLGDRRPADPRDVLERHARAGSRARARAGRAAARPASRTRLAGGADAEHLGHDLGQRHQRSKLGRAFGSDARRRRSASSSTRLITPTVSGRRTRGSGRRAGGSRSGSSRTPHLRWPSRWYLPSSGKNSTVPRKPSPVSRARRSAA